MGASKQLCAKEVAARIQDLHEAGIRFVFFSSQGEKRTRALGAAFGLETGWNCIISLQPSATGDTSYVNMDGKIVLPSGIAAIRQHVREVDNVPLQVSLFCNATPDTVQEMMQVLQENNEVMTCVGSCLRMSNFPLFEQANASIATFVAPDARCRFCGGRCSNFAYHSLLPTLHPSLAFAADMNSLPCALQQSTYPVADPHVTMAVLYEAFRESRRLVDSIQQALTLSLSSAIFLSLFFLFNAFALVPNLLDFASLVLFLLLFTPLLSLALLANPKTDKLMKEHPYKPMDNAQTRHQLVVVFMHFAFRLVPSVIIISALTLAYMFDLGQALYAQLHEEIRLRASADALSARSPAALSVSSTAFSAFSEPQSSSSALLTRLPSDAAEALLRPRRLSAASEETAAGWAPDDRAWRGAAGLEPGAGGARDGREGPLGMQRRLQATEDEAVAMLLPYLENKCNRFRFDPSWLSGKWLACSDAIEEVGAALGEACFVRATSSPLVLGELFCFALVGVTLMLLSMSYIDRFESLFSIPPFRNRWWVACCVVLLLVIVLVVATRVTLHRRYISAADADVELATAKHARLLPSFARGDPARAVLSAAAFGVPRKIDATFPPSPPQAPWSAGDAREAGPRDATPHEAAASRTRRALELTSLAWPHWSLCLIAVILWFFVIVTDELVKRVERQTHEQNQKYLKVLFATRLGMWSPK
ncbi:hypothetical protein BESB_059180 [Besnoitia besnoiti]|uniref:Transmembrane protein n=1 Tax=Besnoitia besnoiti TaxID=94643 RepID=A0A2A9MFK4_BESBE|nr:hypothetical protein BESB_059180 [Besnoitia besnoiti]PFH35031.1 hypothetical protein BESB_059180 [Besnoitia besnoiti]